MDLSTLQNGSDIRGVALPGIPGEEVNLTPGVTERIGMAFARFVRQRTGKPNPEISTGMDPRLSGPVLAEALHKGLYAGQCRVYHYGLATTPAMFMSTQLEGMDGAVMITASHLPYNRNGLKFFTAGGGLEKEDITEILKEAGAPEPAAISDTPEVTDVPFPDTYAEFLKTYIRKSVNRKEAHSQPLTGLHILVDAGNGSGGFFAGRVLEPLGARTTGSLYLDPDGHFPNHAPNPENSEALKGLSEAVVQEHADFGIIFDTDVDRAAFVDRNGTPLNRNRLIALAATVILEEYPGTWVVTDSITSDGLTDFIENRLGGRHHRFKRGYRNVINEAIRLNRAGKECHLAIETSGHAAIKENYFLDDGAFLAAKIVALLARLRNTGKGNIETLIADLPEPAESKELRLRLLPPGFKEYGNGVLEQMQAWAGKQQGWSIVEPNYEGIRVQCDETNGDGWFLLRLSLHDPVMPLNIESNTPGGIAKIQSRLKSFFSGLPGIDSSALIHS